jgi:Putative Actinobacterial Holin-X, holin superfamily III
VTPWPPTPGDMCRRTEQVSTLVRDELKLAQIEMSRKGKQAGLGPGLLGGGLIAVYGVGCLIACAIIGLSPRGSALAGRPHRRGGPSSHRGRGGSDGQGRDVAGPWLSWTTCAAVRLPAAQPTPPTATRSPAHSR